VVFEDIDGRGGLLAEALATRLEELGVYRPERRPWLPHVTVARFRRPPGLRSELPRLGEVSPSEAALYTSVLRRTGAQYEIRESVPLGG
jgi:2'-5' RNA ligase